MIEKTGIKEMHKKYWKLRDKKSQRIVKKSLEKFEVIDIRVSCFQKFFKLFTIREIFYALKGGINEACVFQDFPLR